MPKTDVVVQLSGEDGNIFSILGKCLKAMRRAGHEAEFGEMKTKIQKEAKSYDEALQIIMGYVEVE